MTILFYNPLKGDPNGLFGADVGKNCEVGFFFFKFYIFKDFIPKNEI